MKAKPPYEGFTIFLALMDTLPVLFFGTSVLLTGSCSREVSEHCRTN